MVSIPSGSELPTDAFSTGTTSSPDGESQATQQQTQSPPADLEDGWTESDPDNTSFLTYNQSAELVDVNGQPLNPVTGTAANDVLRGTTGADHVQGLEGNDELYGEGGDDALDGQQGNDFLQGGLGSDTYLFGRGDGQDLVRNSYVSMPDPSWIGYASLTAGLETDHASATDILRFKEGITAADLVVSRDGVRLILGIRGTTDQVTVDNFFGGNDINHNFGVDRIEFADGSTLSDEAIRVLLATGTEASETIMGLASGDLINAKAGNDTVNAAGGDDTVLGGSGTDSLYGQDGNDTLDGQQGNDFLQGGKGSDTYLFGRGDGQDVVRNSNAPNVVDSFWAGSGNANQVLAESTTFIVTVRSPSEAPQLTMPSQVVAVVGQQISVPISVRDLDQDALVFSAVGLPPGATITQLPQYGQALLTWTPTEDDIRIHDIDIVVTDSGHGPQDAGYIPDPDAVIVPNQRSGMLRVVVRPANAAPVLLDVTAEGGVIGAAAEGDAGTATRIAVTEGVPLVLNVFAQDADGDHLSWSFQSAGASANLPAGLNLQVAPGSSQATLRWTPGLFAAQDSTAGHAAGNYRFNIVAGDGAAQFSRTIELTVANVNQAPRILPMPLQLVQEGQTLAFTVLAADADQDATRLALQYDENTPEGLLFDPHTGYLEWTPGQDVVNNAMASNQAFTLNFSASDGQATSTQSVQVRVFDVNRPPVVQVSNHALVVGQSFALPVLLPLPMGEGRGEGISAVDPDGAEQTAALAISFSNLPEGASYDPQARRLAWTPGPGQVGDYTVMAKAWDGFNTSSQTFTLRVVAEAGANAPKILVSTTPSTPAQAGQLVVATIRASSYSAMQSVAVQVQGLDASNPQAWSTVALDGAGRFKFTPSVPGLVNIQVTATDVDGFTHTQTQAIRVKDPADTLAPQLAWRGLLQGATATSRPMTVSELTQLTAGVQDQQLMGWRLQLAAAGTNDWRTLSQHENAASQHDAVANLASLDPASLANGVYQLRLSAWDLQGRTSEIDTRVIVDSATKAAPQANATDAQFILGGHGFTLARTLSSLPLPLGEGGGEGDFGNWQLAGLATHLTTDQPATDAQGMQAPWSEGARLWISAPALDGSPGANLQFTLTTINERLGSVPGAPVVVRPMFANNQGWALQAHGADSLDAQARFIPTQAEALQRQGTSLYSQATGLPWVPTGYTLTGPDGTRHALDAQGRVTAIQFTDGAQWLISDAGIAAVGTAHRVDFVRDAQGRISRVGSAEATIAYRYDAQGRLILARALTSLPSGDGSSSLPLPLAEGASSLPLPSGDGSSSLPLPLGEGGGEGSAALNQPYGYESNGALLHDTITANFGAALNWNTGALASGWSGTLIPGQTTSLGFNIRQSEIASTVKTPGAQGAVIVAIEADLAAGQTSLQVTGATVLGTRSDGSKQTTLVRITEAGLKLIRLTGEGQTRIRIALAGDLNRDGLVNGIDSQTWEQAPGDIDGDGQATQTDRQILYANYGLRANQAPVSLLPPRNPQESGSEATPASAFLKTHTDLVTRTGLATVAQDLEGDSIFWQVLGATHGTAALSPDGQSIVFTPEAGYSGRATVTVQADDGFAAGAPMELEVNVSGSRLISIHVARIAALATGQSGQLQVTGDFEDEEGVALTGSYAQFTSFNSDVVSVSNTGAVRGLSDGIALVQVQARGIAGVNVFTVSAEGHGPGLDDNGFEVDVYPRAITLPLMGQRQLKVTLPDATTGMPTNISASLAGTRYFVSDANIAEITPEGLILAKATGVVTLSIVNGGRQQDIVLNVQEAQVGSATITGKSGVAVRDIDGNMLMVAPGTLPAGTSVSIRSRSFSSLGLPVPASHMMELVGAVDLDLTGNEAGHPLQLTIKTSAITNPANGLPEPLQAGTEVYFWRKGVIRDELGQEHATWWLVDNGFVGADGIARTASPPYDGIFSGGTYGVTALKVTNPNTGEMRVGGGLGSWDAIWSPQNSFAMSAAPFMALNAIGLLATSGLSSLFRYTLNGAYRKDVPSTAFDLANIDTSFESPPATFVYTPSITAMTFEPQTRKLKLTATNLLPPGQAASNFNIKVWLMPRGSQLLAPQENGAPPDRGLVWQGYTPSVSGTDLEIELPDGIALSMHHIYIERIATGSGSTGSKVAGFPVDSDPIEGWTLGTRNTLVVTSGGIQVMRTDGQTGPGALDDETSVLSLVGTIDTDQNGDPLKLNGRFSDSVAFSADGSLAFVAGSEGRIYVVDNQTNRVTHTLLLANGAGAAISSLGSNDGWLYATEGGGASGGRLIRINIDPLAEDFLREQQVIQFAANAPMGFADLAINNGSYLAVTAPQARSSYSNNKPSAPGNVYIIDLGKIGKNGKLLSETALTTLDASKLAGLAMHSPRYITSGNGDAEFLLSSEQNISHGLATIKLNLDSDGNTTGSAEVKNNIDLSRPRAEAGPYLMGKHGLNIRRAAGNVVVQHGNMQYALVADFNLPYSDAIFAYGHGKQFGGKIGVVQDPFGPNPKYLGATTPIVGSSIDHLVITEDGKLIADALTELRPGTSLAHWCATCTYGTRAT